MSLQDINLRFFGVQKDYFECGPQPSLFLGGVGAGKTYIGLLKMLYLLNEYPGSRGVVVRQRFSQLKRTTAATLWKLLPPQMIARRNDNEGFVKLKNGSELLMAHLDKEDSIDNLKSLELNFAYIDQLEDIKAIAWDTLMERIGRWTGAMRRGGYPPDWPYRDQLGNMIPPRYIFASCYSPGYENWITHRFWEKGDQREKYAKQGYKVFIGSTRDNKALSKDYIEGRLAMGEEYVQRYVDAIVWGANEGRVFEILDDSILDPTEELLAKIKRTMRLHRVLDHGDSSPTGVLWYATDHDGNVFVHREYMEANLLISQHRQNVFNLSCHDGITGRTPPVYYSNLADPSIIRKDRGRKATQIPTHSVADEWSDRRIMDPETAVYWRGANNDESMTVNRLREYLRIDPNHRNPITGVIGAPRLYFLRRTDTYPHGCKEVLVDIRAAKREVAGETSEGEKLFKDERDKTVRDHLLDCTRYLVGARPALAIRPAMPEAEAGSIRWSDYKQIMEDEEFEAENERRANFTGSARYGY